MIASAFPQQSLVPGGIAIIEIPANTQASYGNHFVAITTHKQRHYAIVGIPLSAKTGQHQLVLSNGKVLTFKVKAKDYPSQYLTIKNKRMVNPYQNDRDKIIQDKHKKKQAIKTWSDSIPNVNFIQPVPGIFSSPFGLKRFFNQQARSPHSGLDIAAPTGTKIIAPSAGKVILADNFFFNGNVIYIDHGQGLISSYSHLSKILVEANQQIKQGDTIGLVGETGRVTGAHLHWSVYLNQTLVDPKLFLPKP